MLSNRSLHLSDEAEDDLRSILEYSLETWGELQCDTYSAALSAAVDELVRFPEIGRTRDDLFPGCRMRSVRQHVIYYHLNDDAITVFRVMHAKMDASTYFDRTPPIHHP